MFETYKHQEISRKDWALLKLLLSGKHLMLLEKPTIMTIFSFLSANQKISYLLLMLNDWNVLSLDLKKCIM